MGRTKGLPSAVRVRARAVAGALVLLWAAPGPGWAQLTAPSYVDGARMAPRADHGRGPATRLQAPFDGDAVARLQARLDAGAVVADFDTVTGWLPAVLEALDVPVASQTLVFSRTSLQTDRIGPWAPRALYFNDEVYVGYVQDGGLLEVAAVEPTGGVVFYSVAQAPAERPSFQREDGNTCLMCHASRALTGGVPGLILRSVLTDRLGYPIAEIHDGSTTLRTPVARRWGGWYVTGLPTDDPHPANVWASDLRHEVADVSRYLADFPFAARRLALSGSNRFDPSPYLLPSSDPVALAVLAHQVEVHNLLAQAHEDAATALRESGVFDASDDRAYEELTERARTRVDWTARRLVDALLFVGEAPWPGGISGDPAFQAGFEARGPRDGSGRSLRDLRLEGRLFQHPLSYLVYTPAFATLPRAMAERVRGRLDEVLTAPADEADYAHLDEATRRAIREILAATLPASTGQETGAR